MSPFPVLPPVASSIAVWSAKEAAPWAIRKVGRMFTRCRERAAERRAMKEIAAIAASTPADQCVAVFARCAPGGPDGIVGNELRFAVRILALAPFAVRPHRLTLRGRVLIGGAECPFLIDDRPLVSDNKLAGHFHIEEVTVNLDVGDRRPASGSSVSMKVDGEVTLCGPWECEYQKARFSDGIFVQVR